MSVDVYRRQVSQIRTEIARLTEKKAREAQRAADAGKKALGAHSAANKAKSSSTLKTKLREASRHAEDKARCERELATLEKKIASEEKKLVAAQTRLAKEEARALKKKSDDERRYQDAQQRQLRAMKSSLTTHERLHRETLDRVDRLSALPQNIVVAFFATDPATASEHRLLLDEEVREIQEKIRLSDHRDAVKLESRWALRPRDILQYMNELEPVIVHFSGHGTEQDELVLQDIKGGAAIVPMEGLVSAFALFGTVRLVFFNTCHSYNQAAACTQHVDAAIGMNRSIGDTAARVFSSQFYSAIGFGKSVPVAFEQARNALMLEGIPESSTPVLYLREGVEADDLILVKPREKLRSAL